ITLSLAAARERRDGQPPWARTRASRLRAAHAFRTPYLRRESRNLVEGRDLYGRDRTVQKLLFGTPYSFGKVARRAELLYLLYRRAREYRSLHIRPQAPAM